MSQPLDPRRIEVIDDATAAMYRSQTGAESVRAGLAMFDFDVEVVRSSVRQRHPDWTPSQVEAEAARRLYPDAA